MVIGQSAKPEDIELNVCKTKHLTNTRASGADEALKLTPPRDSQPGAGAGIYRHGRASGGDAQESADPEKDPGSHAAQESGHEEKILIFL